MTTHRRVGIFFSALIVAVGGIIYELIIGTVSTYLLGNSILQFSLTIGIFLFGMGLGSLLVPIFKNPPEEKFTLVEILIALIGGNAPLILFSTFALTPLFYPVFVGLVLSLGILIGFEIPTILQIMTNKNQIIQIISKILALDYLGALMASILFPIILLPYLGIIRTAYLVGLANLIIAGMIFWSFKETIKLNHRIIIGLLIISGLILTGGLVYTNQIAWWLDHKLYQDEVIHSVQSQYQKIVLTKYNDDLRLFLDGSIQFSSIDEYRYHEPLVHIPISLAAKHEQILILGGGDGLAVREVLKYPSVQSIELVDLDPAITTLASTNPLLTNLNQNSLKNPKVKIYNQDAIKFLESNSKIYHLIIIDLPDPNNEGLAKLYSKEFYRLVKRHLSEDGVFITQATSPYFSTNTFWIIKNTIEDEQLQTLPLHSQVPSFGEWGFILGSHRKINPADANLLVETKYLTAELIPTMFIFDKDLIPEEEVEQVNSFINPVILKSYEEDARRWQP